METGDFVDAASDNKMAEGHAHQDNISEDFSDVLPCFSLQSLLVQDLAGGLEQTVVLGLGCVLRHAMFKDLCFEAVDLHKPSSSAEPAPEPLLVRGSLGALFNLTCMPPLVQFGTDVLQAVEKARAAAPGPALKAQPYVHLFGSCQVAELQRRTGIINAQEVAASKHSSKPSGPRECVKASLGQAKHGVSAKQDGAPSFSTQVTPDESKFGGGGHNSTRDVAACHSHGLARSGEAPFCLDHGRVRSF